MTDFGEDMKELIKKGVEEAMEKAMEAVRQSLAEWVKESQTTTKKKMRNNYAAPLQLATENDEGGREIEDGGEGTQAKETSKLRPEMPALKVFDENSERKFVQKAPKSIAPALNITLTTVNKRFVGSGENGSTITARLLDNRDKVVRVNTPDQVAMFDKTISYKFHENEYGKFSPNLEDNLRLRLPHRLKWLIDSIIDKDIYSSIMVLQIPVLYGSGQSLEFSYRPMFLSIIQPLKTFMVVVSSTLACREITVFLFGNIVHPYFLCRVIVMELLRFRARHTETDLANDEIDQLGSLLKVATTSESIRIPCSGLRILARSNCVLLAHCSQSTIDRVYHSVIDRSISKLSSMYAALLGEEIPLNLLTDKSLQVRISDTNMKTLKLLVSVINKYRDTEGKVKDNYQELLSETLGIISIIKHMHESDEMERIVIELKNLFISGQIVSNDKLSRCKPNLALVMAGFSHIELAEDDDSSKSVAVWKSYNMLLREQYWALVHLALKAFGDFASWTNCNQLWRFVPQDAALSFDVDSSKEANVESFMSKWKRFLEKEAARTDFTINHYVGDVTYVANQFLDKNKDYLVAEHQALLDASKCNFVASYGSSKSYRHGGSKFGGHDFRNATNMGGGSDFYSRAYFSQAVFGEPCIAPSGAFTVFQLGIKATGAVGVFVNDQYLNWDPNHGIKVRIVSPRAYHSLFMHNMYIRPTPEELEDFGTPDFTIYNSGKFPCNRYTHYMTSSTSIDINLARREMVILGTLYAGEMKKSLFSLMHYIMPKHQFLSLHSGCNMGKDGAVALFLELLGTGKTTLSTDHNRYLIRDNEHCWSENGVSNTEGGSYAKCIDLVREKEPDIWNAIRFGTVVEIVVFDEHTREVDYSENTRAAYPIEYIPNTEIPCVGLHPKNVILLACDAFDMLPPVSKLSLAQTMYHVISGYTALVAETEDGIKEPQATFSACFAAAFIRLHPTKYAAMLAEKIKKRGATGGLVNTGWCGEGWCGEGWCGITFDLEDKVVVWERGIVMDWPNYVGHLNFKRSRPKISPWEIKVWRLKEGK